MTLAVKSLVEEVVDNDLEYVDSDIYHSIAYVPKNDFLWEIDGLQKRPEKLCSIGDNSWVESVKPYIEARMAESVLLSLIQLTQ
ncbi:hypothetical protein BDB01DRAFT_408008 [Pilobolus umbonatus]|nr:hypothetical protein BDB01DRAFT_408008 [Pilobolus umbonatus]